LKENDDLSVNIKEYLENSPFEVCLCLLARPYRHC
jgi:hypothetical protein